MIQRTPCKGRYRYCVLKRFRVDGNKRYEYATCGCVLFESAEKNHRLQKYRV